MLAAIFELRGEKHHVGGRHVTRFQDILIGVTCVARRE
jgi:hypothetical protein